MIIGITGSSGAGKSTVCQMLKEKYSATIINADIMAKNLSQKGNEYYNEIVKQFGKDILLENEELNRKKLAQIIYKDKSKREILNNITFKHVRKAIEEYIRKLSNTQTRQYILENKQIIAIDAPLLLEAGLEDLCDKIICVISEKRDLQIERIMRRDNITEEQALARLGAQKENEFYKSKSNYIIVNNENLEDLHAQVDEFMKKINIH